MALRFSTFWQFLWLKKIVQYNNISGSVITWVGDFDVLAYVGVFKVIQAHQTYRYQLPSRPKSGLGTI